jgi:hypothetical protein
MTTEASPTKPEETKPEESKQQDQQQPQSSEAPVQRHSLDLAVMEAGLFAAPVVHEPEPPKAPAHKSALRPWMFRHFIGLDRVRGLSDAIVAIIITLLVVEIHGTMPF